MNSNNHPEDQASIEAMHKQYVNKLDQLNDDLMNFQDDAYALGRSRGLKEGDELRSELLEAVERLVKLNMPLTGNPTHEQLVDFWEYEKTVGRGEADDQLFVLAVIAKAGAK